MNVVIEKLEKKDLKNAIEIYDVENSVKTNYDKLLSIYDNIYNNPLYHNIVAKVDGKIVGLASIIINYDIVLELKPFLTIWNFVIKKEYRRKGIGTKMFEYINEFAKKNNCNTISLITEPNNLVAQSFYDSLGYTKLVSYVKLVDSEKWGNDYKAVLISNIDKIHTTKLGEDRIKKNIKINGDVVEYLKEKIIDSKSIIHKEGKNYYCDIDGIRITINSFNYSIITAHIK